MKESKNHGKGGRLCEHMILITSLHFQSILKFAKLVIALGISTPILKAKKCWVLVKIAVGCDGNRMWRIQKPRKRGNQEIVSHLVLMRSGKQKAMMIEGRATGFQYQMNKCSLWQPLVKAKGLTEPVCQTIPALKADEMLTVKEADNCHPLSISPFFLVIEPPPF